MPPVRLRRSVLGCVLLLCLSACGGDAEEPAAVWQTTPGPLMRPGDNCLRCHNPVANTAPPWSAAGTVYDAPDADRNDGVAGVTVIVSDAGGKSVALVTNEAGNFHTAEALVNPLRIRLEYEGRSIEMSIEAPAGSCNACHADPPVGGAPGRIVRP
ncbi:hypothetical protein WME73_25120 [Sorangium sp. So ce302]|uniref:hypothetical protein n=1 Tax=Sorangium sp. So ce302 TaxID=3133297 RepID=UPI003F60E667